MSYADPTPDEWGYYISEHYGKCKLEVCNCLTQGWKGTKCSNWVPVKARNWTDLIEEMKGLTER